MLELLSKAYMARIEYHLEFQETITLKQEMLLHLRRELSSTARNSGFDDLVEFLDPGLPDDPYARKLFQKPAPPFVIEMPAFPEQEVGPGDYLVLKVVFFGNLGENIVRFARLLQILGSKGLFKGEGQFELDMIVGRDQADNQQLLYRSGDLPGSLSAPQLDLRWYIETRSPESGSAVLDFITPARLMSDGKPLFNCRFSHIFPFILRRVTSMLYFWAGVELTDDPQLILEAAKTVRDDCSGLKWLDWRQLHGDDGHQDLGGLQGELRLEQLESGGVLTILLLGELMHIGKGAAYGTGQYRLVFSQQ